MLNYIDKTVLKLKEKYNKDELINLLIKQISDLKVEIGKNDAYILELEDEIHKKNTNGGKDLWYIKYKNLKSKLDNNFYYKECQRLYTRIKKNKKNI